MVHMAIKVEQQLKRKGTRSFQNPGSSTSWKSNWRKDEGVVLKSKIEPPKRREEVPSVNKGKTESQTRNRDIKCVSLKVLIPINWLINPRIFMKF